MYTLIGTTVLRDGRTVAHMIADPVNGRISLMWERVADYDPDALDWLLRECGDLTVEECARESLDAAAYAEPPTT